MVSPVDPLPLCTLVQAQVLQRPRHGALRAPSDLQRRGARLGVGMCTRPGCCAPVAEGRPSPGRRAAVALGCPRDITPLCLMVLLKASLGPGLGASRPSLKSWLLCGTSPRALCTYGPYAGVHWGLFEVMAPVRERSAASLKPWPLCRITLEPL